MKRPTKTGVFLFRAGEKLIVAGLAFYFFSKVVSSAIKLRERKIGTGLTKVIATDLLYPSITLCPGTETFCHFKIIFNIICLSCEGPPDAGNYRY